MSKFFVEEPPCPVCQTVRPEPGNTYCSERCRETAFNFRRRVAKEHAYLGTLGFTITVHSGIYFETVLPDIIKPFYPYQVHKFFWPEPHINVALANADDYWKELNRYLGFALADFTRWMYQRAYAATTSADLFKLFAGVLHSTDSFVCKDCGKTFIKSDESQVTGLDLCHDCSIAAIPF